jgi:hypothetical protein
MSKQNILITALFCAVIYFIAIADYANVASSIDDPRCSGLGGR